MGGLARLLALGLAALAGLTGATHAQANEDKRTEDEPPAQPGREERLPTQPERDEAGTQAAGPERESPPSAPEPAPLPQRTTLDLTRFSRGLLASDDPIGYLEELVLSIEARTSDAFGASDEDDADREGPGALERFLARSLREAGIANEQLREAGVSVARLSTSGLFYLRTRERELPYGAYLRVLAVEAALNGALLASGLLAQTDDLALEDVYRALQTLDARVPAQAASEPRPVSSRVNLMGSPLASPYDGEWTQRWAISRDIECLRLPYRLSARFRLNREAGEAAVVFEYTPPEVIRASCNVDGIGVIRRSQDMLEREAGAYALRVALLLARRVLCDCPQVRRVWVADSYDTPATHVCHLCASFDREVLLALDLDRACDPYRLCLALGVTMDYREGRLMPVRQGFSLDDARFCPKWRHEAPELSSKALPPTSQRSLGAHTAKGLEAFEDAPRRRAADDILRMASGSDSHGGTDAGGATLNAVRAVMAAGAGSPDDGMRLSAARCARKLVDGRLDADPWVVAEEFCASDLSEALERASRLLERGRGAEVVSLLEGRLLQLDFDGTYQDGEGVAWRSFGGYADRVAYNRLLAKPGVEVRLVPDDYLELIMALCAAHLMEGQTELACRYAWRACELAPMSTRERLYLISCLEGMGNLDAAKEQANVLLERAHDAESLGWGYYRMARVLWAQGDLRAAEASYQRVGSFLPSLAPTAKTEAGFMALLAGDGPSPRSQGSTDAERDLRDAGVAVAPSPEMVLMMLEVAQAATDAELFPVARELTLNLGAIMHDDIVLGVLRSLEGEPDR